MPTLDQITAFREQLPAEDAAAATLGEETVVEDEDQPEDEGEAVQYFNELPDILGVAPEDFYNLKLKLDTGDEYTFSEVKDYLQKHKRVQEELSVKEKALQEQEAKLKNASVFQEQVAKPISQAVAAANQKVETIKQAYSGVYSRIEELSQAGDTAGLVAAQTDLLRLQGLYGQATDELNAASFQAQQFQERALSEYMQDQQRQLAERIPAFADKERGPEIKAKLKSYLLGQGITPDEVDKLYDARVASLFYKAQQWDDHQMAVKSTKDGIKSKSIKRLTVGSHSGSAVSREKAATAVTQAKTSRLETDKRAAFRAVADAAGIFGKN